jgi:hypothetical protein
LRRLASITWRSGEKKPTSRPGLAPRGLPMRRKLRAGCCYDDTDGRACRRSRRRPSAPPPNWCPQTDARGRRCRRLRGIIASAIRPCQRPPRRRAGPRLTSHRQARG